MLCQIAWKIAMITTMITKAWYEVGMAREVLAKTTKAKAIQK